MDIIIAPAGQVVFTGGSLQSNSSTCSSAQYLVKRISKSKIKNIYKKINIFMSTHYLCNINIQVYVF